MAKNEDSDFRENTDESLPNSHFLQPTPHSGGGGSRRTDSTIDRRVHTNSLQRERDSPFFV